MLKKRLYAVKSIGCENGQKAKLWYFSLEEPWELSPNFGVVVEMERAGVRESACIRHVTVSPGKIKALLSLLSRNTVTPCTLYEVIQQEINKF